MSLFGFCAIQNVLITSSNALESCLSDFDVVESYVKSELGIRAMEE